MDATPLDEADIASIMSELENASSGSIEKRLVAVVDLLVVCTCCPALAGLYERVAALTMTLLRDAHRNRRLPPGDTGRLYATVITSLAAAPDNQRVATLPQIQRRIEQLHMHTAEVSSALLWLRLATAENERVSLPAGLDDDTLCGVRLIAPSPELRALEIDNATRHCRAQIRAFAESHQGDSLSDVSSSYTRACRLAMVAASYARYAAALAFSHHSIQPAEALMKCWPILVARSLPTDAAIRLSRDIAARSNTVNPIRAWQVLREHARHAFRFTTSGSLASADLEEALDDVLQLATPNEMRAARSVVRTLPRWETNSTVLRGSEGRAMWSHALGSLVQHMHAATDVPWRERAPAVLAVLIQERRYDDAIHLFDEYSSLITAADVWSSVAPAATGQKTSPMLHLKAVERFARAVAKTSRWYRALDIVSAIGFCDARLSSPATALTVWRHTAESLRSRWESALALLTLLDTHKASAATRDVCAPYILEAVSKMHKDHGTWLSALRHVKCLIGPSTSVLHAESMVRLTAWLQPRAAHQLVTQSLEHPIHVGYMPRNATIVTATSEQFARHGHWAEAIGLALAARGAQGQSKGLWDTVVGALQHHHIASSGGNDGISNEPRGSSLVACMSACVSNQPTRFVLRGLLRASENHGWLDTLAETVRAPTVSASELSQLTPQHEYGAWAAILREAQKANWTAVRRMLPLTVTDSYLVRAACSAPWMAIATTSNTIKPSQRGHQVAAVKFLWTSDSLRSLAACGGDIQVFAQRVLQVAPQQVLARDLRSAPPKLGGHLFVLPLRPGGRDSGGGEVPSRHADAAADHFHSRMLIVGSCTGCVVATKPPGWSHEIFCTAVQRHHGHQALTSLYKIQPLTQGLVVFAPLGSPTVHYHTTMFLLLGLRKIAVDAVPLLNTASFSKYRMRVVHALPEGMLIPSSEVVVVEAVCSSNATHGPAGSLYDVTMDLALEGWGYVGDAANVADEKRMDHELLGGRRSAAALSLDNVLEGRPLLLLREVVVAIPPNNATHLIPVTRDDATEEAQDDSALVLGRTHRLHIEIPIPRWWGELGLVLSAASGDSGADEADEEHVGDVWSSEM
jgi:hypothetical protein